MPDLLTTAQVAATLGVNASRVRQLALREHIGQRVGRDWVFTAEDCDRLRERPTTPGRPRKTPAV